ncbi:MAG: M15 family metallopeptidase [Pseudomonadota bacterium]
MDIFVDEEPITIDLVYAQPDHPRNIFKEQIYQDGARLWCEYDLARITIKTARILNEKYNWILELKDCLRTYDAQAAMQKTKIVLDNPDWMEGPYPMLSAPGARSHPRAMAIDVCLLDHENNRLDMGTEFDDMSEASHREHSDLPQDVLERRKILEDAFLTAADFVGKELLPLPNEWWDFRFPASYSEEFVPIHESDLPPQMRMVSPDGPAIDDFPAEHFTKLKKDILESLN